MNSKQTPIAVTIGRLRILPRRHRIAHLRALIQHSSHAFRKKKLAALLRDEIHQSFLHGSHIG